MNPNLNFIHFQEGGKDSKQKSARINKNWLHQKREEKGKKGEERAGDRGDGWERDKLEKSEKSET